MNNIYNETILSLQRITTGIIQNLEKFIDFLVEKNIIQMIIGIVIATQVSNIVNIFSTNILTPIINEINILYGKEFSDLNYTILGVTFNYGKLVIGLIQFISILYIIYNIWKISTTLNDGNKLSDILSFYLNIK